MSRCLNIKILICADVYTVLATMTFTGLKPSYLLQMLLKMQIQGQFWKLLVLRIPKHPQYVKID